MQKRILSIIIISVLTFNLCGCLTTGARGTTNQKIISKFLMDEVFNVPVKSLFVGANPTKDGKGIIAFKKLPEQVAVQLGRNSDDMNPSQCSNLVDHIPVLKITKRPNPIDKEKSLIDMSMGFQRYQYKRNRSGQYTCIADEKLFRLFPDRYHYIEFDYVSNMMQELLAHGFPIIDFGKQCSTESDTYGTYPITIRRCSIDGINMPRVSYGNKVILPSLELASERWMLTKVEIKDLNISKDEDSKSLVGIYKDRLKDREYFNKVVGYHKTIVSERKALNARRDQRYSESAAETRAWERARNTRLVRERAQDEVESGYGRHSGNMDNIEAMKQRAMQEIYKNKVILHQESSSGGRVAVPENFVSYLEQCRLKGRDWNWSAGACIHKSLGNYDHLDEKTREVGNGGTTAKGK